MNGAVGAAGWRDWRVGLIAAVWLVALGKLAFTVGGGGAQWWHHDLRTLARDQALFYAGTYPHAALAAGAGEVRTAYPPTSFPLFLPWLPPGMTGGALRAWFAAAQLAALAALAAFAWRRGRAVDARLGWLLTGALLSTSGVRADLLFGNMALITTALLLGALLALERGRVIGAAAAWLAAMVKPQMGWLFALALWRRATWRAWLGAALLLGISGVAACAWTGVSLAATLGVGAGEEATKWAAWSPLNNLPVWLGVAGLSPQAALALGAALAVAAGAWAVMRPGLRDDWLGQFAVLGLVNRIGVYHNYCDDVLLVFALVWLGGRAWRGTRSDWAMWLALVASVALPTSALAAGEAKAAVLLVWAVAAAWIVRRAGRVQGEA